MNTHNTTTTTQTPVSRPWALAVLSERGYATRLTPFGTLAHRPGFSVMLKDTQSLTQFALEESTHA